MEVIGVSTHPSASDEHHPMPVTDEMRVEAYRVHAEIIQRGNGYFENKVAFGTALQEMRDRRLYIAMGFKSFESYCKDVLDATPQWANDEIRAASIMRESGNARFQIANKTQARLLARLDPPRREEFLAHNNVADMTTRQLEEAVREANRAKREAEEARKRAAEAEAKARELANRPPRVVKETVEVVKPDPELAQKHAEMRKEYDAVVRRLEQISRERDQLARQAHKDQALEEAIKEKERRIAELAAMEEEMAARFSDDRRDPKAGMVLTQLVHRLLEVAAPAEVELTRLEAKGVGGWANDDKAREAIKVLRNVTATLQAIMNDRDSRPIEVSAKEIR